jgi:hypothetical protein
MRLVGAATRLKDQFVGFALSLPKDVVSSPRQFKESIARLRREPVSYPSTDKAGKASQLANRLERLAAKKNVHRNSGLVEDRQVIARLCSASSDSKGRKRKFIGHRIRGASEVPGHGLGERPEVLVRQNRLDCDDAHEIPRAHPKSDGGSRGNAKYNDIPVRKPRLQ